MTRPGLLATVALFAALTALAVSIWAGITAAQTREDIRALGEILTGSATPFRMSMDRPPPPQFDPEDR